MPNKDKQVNIRITKTVDDQINKIKEILEKEHSIKYNRSQVIFMLINKGIEKYAESKILS